MSLLSMLSPKLALGRAFPDHVVGYYKTSITGSAKEFSVGYNLVVRDKLINAVTLFGYRKQKSLIDEFSISKSVGISGDDYEHVGEKTVKLAAVDGSYSALMNRYAITLLFDNVQQRVASDMYIAECGSKFIKIRSTFPVSERELAFSKFHELVASLRFNL